MALTELLETADLAFGQIKKISEVTQEADAIFGTLSNWASHIGQINRTITQTNLMQLHQASTAVDKNKKTATEQAMEIYMAKTKVQQMERDLYQMFIYGKLSHLGQDGYKEFVAIRQNIEQEAQAAAVEDQAWALSEEADEKFLKWLKIVVGSAFAAVVAVVDLAERIKTLFE
jgi:chlorite dismutase